MRYPETMEDKGDARSEAMTNVELTEAMHKRYYGNMSRPRYYNTLPAVPELTAIFDAIYYGDIEYVKELLKSIPTLTQMCDSKGNNIFHIAMLYGREDIVEILQKEPHNMSLYQTNKNGESPFLLAAYSGKVSLVITYLKSKPSLIYQRNHPWENDACLMASLYGHITLLEYLLENHKEILCTTRSSSKWNVLETAAYSPNIKAINFLLSNIEWSKEDLMSALAVATKYRKFSEISNKGFIQERVSQYTDIENLLKENINKLNIANSQQRGNSWVGRTSPAHPTNQEALNIAKP